MRRKQVAPSHQVHHRGLLALTEACSGRSCGPAGAGKCAAASSLRPQHFLLLISQAIATHVLRRIQARQQRQQLGGVLPCQRMLTTSSNCFPSITTSGYVHTKRACAVMDMKTFVAHNNYGGLCARRVPLPLIAHQGSVVIAT